MGLSVEQYKIAETNGISRNLAYQRYEHLFWSEEDAITKPVRRSDDDYIHWKDVAQANGISYVGFYKRVKRGMTPEQAATTPKSRSGEVRKPYKNRVSKMEYAVYKGDSLICIGTAVECAEYMGILITSFRYYLTEAYARRVAKRKKALNYIAVERLDD